MNLHDKSSEVSIKTRSTPASLSFNGQATKHTTVKWSIDTFQLSFDKATKITMLIANSQCGQSEDIQVSLFFQVSRFSLPNKAK